MSIIFHDLNRKFCFLHPADTKNPMLLKWLCKEEVRLFEMVRNYDEEGHNSSHQFGDPREGLASSLFTQLDKDSNGYLSDVELLPIIGKLHPSEHYYAKQQADFIMSEYERMLLEAQVWVTHSSSNSRSLTLFGSEVRMKRIGCLGPNRHIFPSL